MNLLLWRHAQAELALDPSHDFDRKLTSLGEKQAKRVAKWLDRQLPQGTQIWVSPAIRAEQTAKALGRPYKLCPELAPGATVAQLHELVQWPRKKGHLLLVGHQPVLGDYMAELLGVDAQVCTMKKGSIWWLRNREREAKNQTVLLTIQTPETL